MNINNAHFGKIEMFFFVHVEMAFVLTSTIYFNIWALSNSKGVLCIYVVQHWDNLHTPNARWLVYYNVHILA